MNPYQRMIELASKHMDKYQAKSLVRNILYLSLDKPSQIKLDNLVRRLDE